MFAKILVDIVILLAVSFFVLVIMQVRTNQQVSQLWQMLESAPTHQHFHVDMIAGLPAPVQRYFLHAIALGTPLATSIKLKMQGQLRISPDKPWLPMQAQEILTSKGFVWKAVIGRGLFQLQGGDYYVNGLGRVQFGLWGLVPFVNAHNLDITRSSIGRLGGEFFWLPSALLLQPNVTWKAIDDNTIQASFQIDAEPVTLTLVIDANGKVLQVWLPRWGDRTEDKSWTYIPFGGVFQAERTFEGLTIPSRISAGWWFGTERYVESFLAEIEVL
ncbi:MAG: DUF6544 family protein [Nostoc sp.]|uniref:DUF6544 family protein n=1 Tax=Nostoc sp. TaxID=1180 RepID=UPI002FF4481F